MTTELVPGGNLALPGGAVFLRVQGPFDVSLLITDDDGSVTSDADFVFYNQPTAPGARLHGNGVTVDPRRLRPGASRVTVVVSPAEPGTPFHRLPAPRLSATGPGGMLLARFTPPRPGGVTVLLLAEIYRRGGQWKLRALGQGYAEGLAGVARDFGVDVAEYDEEGTPAPPPPIATVGHQPDPVQTSSSSPATASATAAAPRYSTAAAASASVVGDEAGFVRLVNAERSRVGVRPVTLDARLSAAARAHAADMAAQGRLGLEDRAGVSLYERVRKTGYTYLSIAEHLVSGPPTAEYFVEYCLSAEDTRRPFLDGGLAQVGIGRAKGRPDYWTAVWAAPFTSSGLARLAAEVVVLTNAEREAAHLPPLALDTTLTVAAQNHSQDMVARDFYSHTTPEGREPWHRASAAGSTHPAVGENIACGQRSAAEVVRGWMDSPGHRANILRRGFTHIGVGYATGGRAGTYWTQVFGGIG